MARREAYPSLSCQVALGNARTGEGSVSMGGVGVMRRSNVKSRTRVSNDLPAGCRSSGNLHHLLSRLDRGGGVWVGDETQDPHVTHFFPPPKQSFARYGFSKGNLVTRGKNDPP